MKIKQHEWHDSTWGKGGIEAWLPLIGFPFLLSILTALVYVFLTEDFEGAYTPFLFMCINIAAMAYIVILAGLVLMRARRQLVSVLIYNTTLKLGAYFNQNFALDMKDIHSIDQFTPGAIYRHFSYLSNSKTNFCLTTINGQKFYISGDMPEVVSLVVALEEIIVRNKDVDD